MQSYRIYVNYVFCDEQKVIKEWILFVWMNDGRSEELLNDDIVKLRQARGLSNDYELTEGPAELRCVDRRVIEAIEKFN